MRHVAQSQCAKVGRGHGRVPVVALTQARALALALALALTLLNSVVVPNMHTHIHTHTLAYTYRQDQTCLRVTVTHILFINIAQKQLIFGNIPISNVCVCECVGSVRTTTNQSYIDCEPPAADQLPADCSQPQNVANSSESLPAAAPAHEVLRPLYRLYRPA